MLIQFFLTLVSIGALLVTWRRTVRDAVTRTEAFLWSVLWVSIVVVVWRPETASLVARFFGVGRGADFVVYLSVVALFWLVFRLFLRTESLERQITTLVREDALQDFRGQLSKHSAQDARDEAVR